MPTVLLILPTGTYRAEEYLAAARRLGVEVVTASEAPQALAGKMAEHFLELPLDRPEEAAAAIVTHDERIHLDGVLAVDDQGLLAAAIASRALGLRHSPPEAVRLTRDKGAMRSAFAAAGVSQPEFALVTDTGPGAVSRAAAGLGPPVVVKPVGLSASRGVIRADSADQAEAAGAWARSIAAEAGEPDSPLLVESFVKGPEVAVEGVLSGGMFEVVTIFDKPNPLDGPYFEETIYLSPTALSPPLAEAVVEEVCRAVAALGLTEGPVHAELRLGEAPGPVVIEVAARTIGGRCSKALSLAGGASLEELVIARLIGRGKPAASLAAPAGVLMVPIPASGRLVAVHHQEEVRALPHVTGVEITVPPGRELRALPEGDRYLGFVFATASERDDVESALREAEAMLDVEMAPVEGGRAGTVS